MIATVLVASGLMAADNVPFIGASVGNAEFKSNVTAVGYESMIKDTQYTATLGQYIGTNARVALSYTYAIPQNNVKNSDAASLAFDFIIPVVEDTVSLYAGPIIGYTRYEEESSGIKLDLSGMHYGGQAGAIVRIVNNIEIEGGYRYLIETGNDTVLGLNVDADTLKMWYIGANFRF